MALYSKPDQGLSFQIPDMGEVFVKQKDNPEFIYVRDPIRGVAQVSLKQLGEQVLGPQNVTQPVSNWIQAGADYFKQLTGKDIGSLKYYNPGDLGTAGLGGAPISASEGLDLFKNAQQQIGQGSKNVPVDVNLQNLIQAGGAGASGFQAGGQAGIQAGQAMSQTPEALQNQIRGIQENIGAYRLQNPNAPITGASLASGTAPSITAPTNVPVPNISNLPVTSPTVPPTSGTAFENTLESTLAKIEGRNVNQEVKTSTAEQQRALNEINTQIRLHLANALARQQEALSKGETLNYSTGLAGEVARTDAIKGMELSALAQAAQGNLAIATDLANSAVDAKYAQLQADLRTQRANVIANYDSFTDAEKKRANELLLRIDANDAFVKETKDKEKELRNIGNTAAVNGAPLALVKQAIATGDTIKANSILHNYLGTKIGTLSDFEAAFQRSHGRLPNIDELTKFKQSTQTTFLTATGAIDRVLTPAEQTLYGRPSGTTLSEVQGEIPIDAAHREKLTSFTQALPIVEAIRNMAEQLELADTTAGTILRGARLKARSLLPSTAEGQYEAQKRSFLTLLSRAAGERGVVTDQDVNRIAGNIPGFFDTKQSAQAKLERFAAILKEVQVRAAAGFVGNPLTQLAPVNIIDPLGLFK